MSNLGVETAWPALRPVSATMHAMVFDEFGPAAVLRQDQRPTPSAAEGEVLVQVAAVSVGRLLDLAARAGTHPYAQFSLPHTLGAEHSGSIASIGPGVDGLVVGQQVATFPVITCGQCSECAAGYDDLCADLELIGTHRPGAYAEYVAVPAGNVRAVPAGIGPIAACALALAASTAMNQFTRAGMTSGDWVVVQAASSGLGSVTAALAQHLGARVIVTSRDEHKRQELRSLGFEHALDGTATDFPEEVRELTAGSGADIVVDNIGTEHLWRNSQGALRRGGTLVSSGAFGGQEVPVNLQRLYSLGQRIVGVRTGNRASTDRVWREAEQGFRPPLAATFPLHQAATAHRFLEKDMNVGRVALVVGA